LIEEVPPEWGYGPIKKEKRRLCDLLNAVALLRSGSVYGAGIIGVYHARGVAPLMARTLSLYKMTTHRARGRCSLGDRTTIARLSSAFER
jgi:hypothetical protein